MKNSCITYACVLSHSVMPDSVTPWTVVHQAPLSMGFSRQDYQNGLPFTAPEDLPDWRIEPESLVLPALAGRFFTTAPPGKPCITYMESLIHKHSVSLYYLLFFFSFLSEEFSRYHNTNVEHTLLKLFLSIYFWCYYKFIVKCHFVIVHS